MSARPLVIGLICILVGNLLILSFFKKCYGPIADHLRAAHAVAVAGPAADESGAGDRYRFSSDIAKRLKQFAADEGHKMQIALAWEGLTDLDLHCVEPGGEEIYYGHTTSATGAKLDVDMNAGGRKSDTPLEHIYFNDKSILRGQYTVRVVLYNWRQQPQHPVSYRLEIMKSGAVNNTFQGVLHAEGDVAVHKFTYP